MRTGGVRVGYAASAAALLLCFFLSALLFCTSMLSTSTVMSNSGQERCAGVRPVDQVVLVLVDAMRPDFVLSALREYARDDGGCKRNRGDKGPADDRRSRGENPEGDDWIPDYYAGPTLRYLQDSINDLGDASHGYFLVADPPTTTAQRIKAIGTGTMPAFLEAGSNFNSDATPLDSIVRQAGGRAVLLGDDTWAKLFPGKQHWKRAVAIPSFDVADFDSNDDAVLGQIYHVLTTETAEADAAAASSSTAPVEPYAKLIVAHFLGIDHVGHRINAANREMDRKIAQLNVMLHNVSRTLRERRTRMNTMLLVLGDHGMTQNGDHGGDSALETDTFLFAQFFRGREHFPPSHREGRDLSAMTSISAPKAALKNRMAAARLAEQADPELLRLDSCRAVAGVDPTQLGAAYQVDITPTVSVLLGNPIPYSNFGRVLPEVVALADEEADLEAVDGCNERQIARYFTESGMEVPQYPPWETTRDNTTRQRIAAMSFYARRTRTDMNMPGMVLGGLALIACAVSSLAMDGVRAVFVSPSATILVGIAVLIIRWVMTLANSFIVHEDIGVFGLFAFYVLVVLCAKRVGARYSAAGGVAASHKVGPDRGGAVSFKQTHRKPPAPLVYWVLRDRLTCVVIVVLAVARCLLPYVLKHRFHITHAVESESLLDGFVRQWVWGNSGALLQRAGLVTGSLLWCMTTMAASARQGTHPKSTAGVAVIAAGTAAVFCGCYGVAVAHHVAPLLLAVGYAVAASRRPQWLPGTALVTPRAYAFLTWVLWAASLCNEQVVASAVIASYGVLLPPFVATLQANGVHPAAQALLLHLLSFTAFFMEGHQCLLSTIDWNASFVGLPAYNMVLGGVLVLSRTFNAFLFAPVACKLVAAVETPPPSDVTDANGRGSAEPVVASRGRPPSSEAPLPPLSHGKRDASALVRYLLLVFVVVEAGMSAFSAFIQRNHLMLFPIFCPKLLFDVVIALMTGAGILLSFL